MATPSAPRTGLSSWGPARLWPFSAALVIVVGLFVPLLVMTWRGLSMGGDLTGDAVRTVMQDSYFAERVAFTSSQALASTVLALLVGLPGAYVFAHVHMPAIRWWRATVLVPFVLPTLVVALAFAQLLGPSGSLNRALEVVGLGPVRPIGTLWAILAAHVFMNVPIVVAVVSRAWSTLDPRTADVATLLGAGRVRGFAAVTVPALLPAVLSAAALVFLFSFMSFGVVLVLQGGNLRLDTVQVAVYRLAVGGNVPTAAIFAALQLVFTVAILAVYVFMQGWAPRRDRLTVGATQRTREARRAHVLAQLILVGFVVFTLVPLASLVYGAMTVGTEGQPTAHFQALWRDGGGSGLIPPLRAAQWSIAFALGSSAIATVLGVAAATAIVRARDALGAAASVLLVFPLAVPGVTLGLAYLVTFRGSSVDAGGSPWLVLAAHALIGYPFVVAVVLGALRRLDLRLSAAAAVLGASPREAWTRVELPLLWPAAVAGAGLCFVLSLGEFGATLLLQRSDFATLPIAIYQALARPGEADLGRALALATVLMLIVAVSFFVVERLRYRGSREAGPRT
jgi:thiamine transport system permease protein